jgi:hypothetical protein
MTTTFARLPDSDDVDDLLVVLPAPSLATRPPFSYDELRHAAARHATSDPLSRAIWHELLACLRLTSLALQMEATSDDPGAQALTVAYALSAGRRGSASLQRRLQRDRRRRGRTLGVRYAPRVGAPVERTSLRLTGLMLGAAPADLELLEAALGSHNATLEEWRGTLTRRLRSG